MVAFGAIRWKHAVAAGRMILVAGLALASASLLLALIARSGILDVMLAHGDVSPTTQLDLAYIIGRAAAVVAPFGALAAAVALFLDWQDSRSRLPAFATLLLAAGLVMLRPALDEQLGAITRLSPGPFMLEIFIGLALLIITWPTRKAALATAVGLAFIIAGFFVAMATGAFGTVTSSGIVAIGLATFAISILSHAVSVEPMAPADHFHGPRHEPNEA